MICSLCLHEVPTMQGHINRRHQNCETRTKGDGTTRSSAGKWSAEMTPAMRNIAENRKMVESYPS